MGGQANPFPFLNNRGKKERKNFRNKMKLPSA